jgi:hypothetical protein
LIYWAFGHCFRVQLPLQWLIVISLLRFGNLCFQSEFRMSHYRIFAFQLCILRFENGKCPFILRSGCIKCF